MKKINVLWIIINSIFLVVFNTCFFLIGGMEHPVSVWISYGFIHAAYLMLLLTPSLIRGGKSAAMFGFSLYSTSAAYFLIEFIIGTIFILASPEGYKMALLVQICIAAFYGVILTANIIANEKTADAEEERRYQIEYVKNASAKLKYLLDNADDKEAKKKIERVYDALCSSPVKSHFNLTQIENNILQSVDELENAVSAGSKERIISLSDSLLKAVNERNLRLKTLN